jgi:thioredoxin-like negative regulator of GroEL
MKQELSKIASEYESFDILAFNIEDDLDLAHSFGVKSVPSLFIVNNNKIIGPKTGLFTNNEIKE